MNNQKISMRKKRFRIGELSEQLKIKKFVIRFWEKEFELLSDRSNGGQRFYTQDDLDTFTLIKELLYKKKFTISGAKKELQRLSGKNGLIPAIKQDFIRSNNVIIPNEFFLKLNILKEKLIKLNEQL